jgi:hypothetical protein
MQSLGRIPIQVSELRAFLLLLSNNSIESKAMIYQSAHDMVENMYEVSPDISELVELFSIYQSKGWTNSPENIIQDLKLTMAMTLERHMKEFKPKEVLQSLCDLTSCMHRFSFTTYREYESLMMQLDQLTSAQAHKLLKTYAILGRNLPGTLSDMAYSAMERSTSAGEIIESIEALCVVKAQDKIWGTLKNFDARALNYSLSQKLRVIKFACEVERPELEIPIVSKYFYTSDSEAVQSHQSTDSNLLSQVRYILEKLRSPLQPNFNVEDAYIVDFGKGDLLMDLESKGHYFRPTRGFTFDTGALLNGYTEMKYRLLRQKKYKIIRLPFYEWNRYSDEIEKTIYLQRKLRLVK